jgi:hypothetical protein
LLSHNHRDFTAFKVEGRKDKSLSYQERDEHRLCVVKGNIKKKEIEGRELSIFLRSEGALDPYKSVIANEV